ncbi:MAG: class I SAM-dependent methyltransferase [Gemmataceae bacterium]|nr:class I SAM-dependent methyltransferase [Gemmataceae bacterium]
MPPNWRLPPGVSRALWDYCHDPANARRYDDELATAPLTNQDIQFVVEHCQTPARLIDLGCGTGRLSLALAERGFRPLAVDLSPEMLCILQSKAKANGLAIPCLQANLVELDALADASFDYAACLFSTLGLIEGVENRRRFLGHVRRLLGPGGMFVLHAHNFWFHLWTRRGRRLLWRNRFRGDFLMPPHDGAASMNMHLFTRREIRRELRLAGFSIVELRPVSHKHDGRLRCPWWWPGLRAYGYLIACRVE